MTLLHITGQSNKRTRHHSALCHLHHDGDARTTAEHLGRPSAVGPATASTRQEPLLSRHAERPASHGVSLVGRGRARRRARQGPVSSRADAVSLPALRPLAPVARAPGHAVDGLRRVHVVEREAEEILREPGGCGAPRGHIEGGAGRGPRRLRVRARPWVASGAQVRVRRRCRSAHAQ